MTERPRGWIRKNRPIPEDMRHLPDGTPVRFEPDIDAAHQYECDRLGNDPATFCREMFEWGKPYSFIAKQHGPYKWQEEILEDMTVRLAEDDSMYRLAISAGKGPGKTALLSMLFLWHIMTHRHSLTMLLGPTGDALDQKTWNEIGKWFSACKMRQFFKRYRGGRIVHTYHDTWTGSYHLWGVNRLEALHGAHSEHLAFFVDEACGVPNEVLQTIESGLNDPHCMMCCISNPTRRQSRFRQYFPDGTLQKQWHTWQIDVRDTERHNPARVQELLEGDCEGDEDHPWFLVNVRGRFPLNDSEQYITQELIERAKARQVLVHPHTPIVIGADISWKGENKTVFTARQGALILRIMAYSKLEIPDTARRLADFIDSMPTVRNYMDQVVKPKVYIDTIGLGAGVYGLCKEWGYDVHKFNSALPATGPKRDEFTNERMRIWFNAKEWLRTEGMIGHALLEDQLMKPLAVVDHRGKLILESKDQLRSRGEASPDYADSFCYSFAGVGQYRGTAQVFTVHI
jgi:hypothetical protein